MRRWTQWMMRAVAMGLLLMPMTGRSEEWVNGRRTVILAQPLYGLTGRWGASAEHAVSAHVALSGTVQLAVHLDDNRYDSGGGTFSRELALGVDPGVHFYLSGQAPEGFWVGPHLELSVTHHQTWMDAVSPEGQVTSSTGGRTLEAGGSARVGYTAILSSGLSLQVALGLAVLHDQNVQFSLTSTGLGAAEPLLPRGSEWSLSPRMTLGVGWAL